jgi:hypothetical protein
MYLAEMVPVYVRLDVYGFRRPNSGPLVCALQAGNRGDAEDLECNLPL